MATVTLKGNTIRTSGDLPAKGAGAPDFRLTGGDLKDVTLQTFGGKQKVLNIVPSLDTGICQISARRFNEKIQRYPDAVVLTISADLPFAQQRFCEGEGLTHVIPLSMMRSRQFAKDYGVLMTDGPLEGIAARAVVVLDGGNRVVYTQLVPEIGQEPDYDAALAAVR